MKADKKQKVVTYMTKSDIKEISACQYLIRRFKTGYGTCKEMSTDSIKEMRKGGCPSCQATLAIEFLKEHIKIIKL